MSRISPPMRSLLFGALSLSLVGGLAISSSARQDKKPAKKTEDKKPAKKLEEKKPPTGGKMMAPEAVKTVLIFSADTSLEGVAPTLADTIAEVQQAKLQASDKFSTVKFRRSLPTIRRGVIDGSVGTADVDKPYDVSDAKVKRLASLAGYPVTLVTTINDYQYDAAKNQVSLVVTMKMVDFSKDPPLVKSGGDSYTGPEAPKSKKESVVAMEAARAISEKMITDLLAPSKPKPAESK